MNIEKKIIMARGRKCVPSSASEGVWFRHIGEDPGALGSRLDITSTGHMLSAPFKPASATQPRPPPELHRAKTEYNYKGSNPFSQHDNRHSFQDHGVYFADHRLRKPVLPSTYDWGRSGRELGRKLTLPDVRLHSTESNFLKHHGRIEYDRDFNSTYYSSYQGQPSQAAACRRFKKSLPAPPTGQIPLDTMTTDWKPTSDPSARTSTQVLAVSQEPFLKHNAWKYSYHSLRNVYPQYQTRSEPIIDNTFNKYGAGYITSASDFR